MGKVDISQLPLSDITKLCVHLSIGKSKIGKGLRDPSLARENKCATRSVSRAEIGNMLDKFKTKKKTKADALAIFCPKCRKKHALRECPLDEKIVESCTICSKKS